MSCLPASRLQTQCETTQVHDHGMGAALFGYTKLYGEVPGGQAEYLRVPQAQYGPIKVPDGPPDERFLFRFATHTVPLDKAPESYEMFQQKRDGAVKVLLKP